MAKKVVKVYRDKDGRFIRVRGKKFYLPEKYAKNLTERELILNIVKMFTKKRKRAKKEPKAKASTTPPLEPNRFFNFSDPGVLAYKMALDKQQNKPLELTFTEVKKAEPKNETKGDEKKTDDSPALEVATPVKTIKFEVEGGGDIHVPEEAVRHLNAEIASQEQKAAREGKRADEAEGDRKKAEQKAADGEKKRNALRGQHMVDLKKIAFDKMAAVKDGPDHITMLQLKGAVDRWEKAENKKSLVSRTNKRDLILWVHGHPVKDDPLSRRVKEIHERFFAQELAGRKGLQDGSGFDRPLTTDELDKVLAKCPDYLGAIPRDGMKDLQVRPGKRMAFIMNMDPHTKPGSHWVAWYIDPVKDQTIEYYDSFGEPIPLDVLKSLKALVARIQPKTHLKVKENKIVQQSDESNNCGPFAVRFLVDRFRGKPFAECTGFNDAAKGEHDIEKFKEKYPPFRKYIA